MSCTISLSRFLTAVLLLGTPLAVRALGVTRIGATATKAILDECREKLLR